MLETYCNDDICKKILQRYIRVDSSQPKGNERDMVTVILDLLPEDVKYSIIEHTPDRQSLIVKIAGENPEGGVAFVGHIDTVPFGDCSSWKYHPLSAEEEDGKIYGRGASDMKGGVAAMTAVIQALLKYGKKPKSDLYFCFTADEENEGIGAVALSKSKELEGVSEFIIAEPSYEQIGVSEKGALWIKICAKGKLSHSSRPEEGINAIEKLIEFYQKLTQFLDTDTQDKYLGHSTIAITKLQGGVSTNVVPDTAEMELDIRTLTNINHDDILHFVQQLIIDMERKDKGLQLDMTILNNRPAVGTKEDCEMVKHIAHIYQEMHMNPVIRGLMFYTDASQIIPSNPKPFVIMGPGDDKLAHQTNEYISVSSVTKMSKIYIKYLLEYFYEEDEK